MDVVTSQLAPHHILADWCEAPFFYSEPFLSVYFFQLFTYYPYNAKYGSNYVKTGGILEYESYRNRSTYRLSCYNKTKPRNPDKSMVFADFVQENLLEIIISWDSEKVNKDTLNTLKKVWLYLE